MKRLKKPVKTANWICVLLMALVLLLQFAPFWSVDGEDISLLGYWCFPDDNSNLTSWLKDTLGNFDISEIVFWILFIVACSVIGIVVCIKNRDKAMALLLPAIDGLLGVMFCICEPSFRLGQIWILHLILFLLLLTLPVLVLAVKTQGKCKEA